MSTLTAIIYNLYDPSNNSRCRRRHGPIHYLNVGFSPDCNLGNLLVAVFLDIAPYDIMFTVMIEC